MWGGKEGDELALAHACSYSGGATGPIGPVLTGPLLRLLCSAKKSCQHIFEFNIVIFIFKTGPLKFLSLHLYHTTHVQVCNYKGCNKPLANFTHSPSCCLVLLF